jgi:hypothetical protein
LLEKRLALVKAMYAHQSLENEVKKSSSI